MKVLLQEIAHRIAALRTCLSESHCDGGPLGTSEVALRYLTDLETHLRDGKDHSIEGKDSQYLAILECWRSVLHSIVRIASFVVQGESELRVLRGNVPEGNGRPQSTSTTSGRSLTKRQRALSICQSIYLIGRTLNTVNNLLLLVGVHPAASLLDVADGEEAHQRKPDDAPSHSHTPFPEDSERGLGRVRFTDSFSREFFDAVRLDWEMLVRLCSSSDSDSKEDDPIPVPFGGEPFFDAIRKTANHSSDPPSSDAGTGTGPAFEVIWRDHFFSHGSRLCPSLFRLPEGQVGFHLGAGATGKVRKDELYPFGDVALKQIEGGVDSNAESYAVTPGLQNEFVKISSLIHPNVVFSYGWHRKRYLALVMNLVPHSFDFIIKSNPAASPWPVRAHIAVGIAQGLTFLHARGVSHNDIKSPNVMIGADGRTPVLIDFELSMSLHTVKIKRKPSGHTPAWSAPELYSTSPIDIFLCDIYSFGRTLSELLRGSPPLASHVSVDGCALQSGVRGMSNEAPSVQLMRKLIGECAATDPAKRPTSMAYVLGKLRDIEAQAWIEMSALSAASDGASSDSPTLGGNSSFARANSTQWAAPQPNSERTRSGGQSETRFHTKLVRDWESELLCVRNALQLDPDNVDYWFRLKAALEREREKRVRGSLKKQLPTPAPTASSSSLSEAIKTTLPQPLAALSSIPAISDGLALLMPVLGAFPETVETMSVPYDRAIQVCILEMLRCRAMERWRLNPNSPSNAELWCELGRYLHDPLPEFWVRRLPVPAELQKDLSVDDEYCFAQSIKELESVSLSSKKEELPIAGGAQPTKAQLHQVQCTCLAAAWYHLAVCAERGTGSVRISSPAGETKSFSTLTCLTKALEARPDFVPAWVNLGNALSAAGPSSTATVQGKPFNSKQCYREAIRSSVANLPFTSETKAEVLSTAWYNLGQCLLAQPGSSSSQGESLVMSPTRCLEESEVMDSLLEQIRATQLSLQSALQKSENVVPAPAADVAQTEMVEQFLREAEELREQVSALTRSEKSLSNGILERDRALVEAKNKQQELDGQIRVLSQQLAESQKRLSKVSNLEARVKELEEVNRKQEELVRKESAEKDLLALQLETEKETVKRMSEEARLAALEKVKQPEKSSDATVNPPPPMISPSRVAALEGDLARLRIELLLVKSRKQNLQARLEAEVEKGNKSIRQLQQHSSTWLQLQEELRRAQLAKEESELRNECSQLAITMYQRWFFTEIGFNAMLQRELETAERVKATQGNQIQTLQHLLNDALQEYGSIEELRQAVAEEVAKLDAIKEDQQARLLSMGSSSSFDYNSGPKGGGVASPNGSTPKSTPPSPASPAKNGNSGTSAGAGATSSPTPAVPRPSQTQQPESQLIEALKKNDLFLFQALLQSDPFHDVFARYGPKKESVMMVIARLPHHDALGAYKLVEGTLKTPGVEGRIDETNADGETALMIAASKGNAELCEKLVTGRFRASLTIDGSQGQGVLHYAVNSKSLDTVRVLCKLLKDNCLDRVSAVVNKKAGSKRTPLMFAVKLDQADMCRVLLEFGADRSIVDEGGKTAFDLARTFAAHSCLDLVKPL